MAKSAGSKTSEDPFALDLDGKSLRSRAFRGSAITGGAQLAKLSFQLVSAAVLGRLLFPGDFGLMAMVTPIIGFVQLFGNLGFGQAIVQRQSLRDEDVSALFWLNLIIAMVLVVVAIAAAPLASVLYREPRIVLLMMAIALTLPIGALGSIHGAILARQMRFGIITRNDLISNLLGLVGTISFAATGFSYWALVMGQVIVVTSYSVLAWVSANWRPLRPAYRRDIWEEIKFGANLTGANIATFITASGDNIIVGALNGKVALGIYDRGYRLVAQPISQMLGPLSAVALPLLSRLLPDPPEYKVVYLNFVRLIMLVNLPIMLVCIVNADSVVILLLGPHWHAAAPAFRWISVGGLLSGFYTSLPWLFISQAKTSTMRHYMSIAAVFNLASFALGAIWGVAGVAACAAIVFLLVTVPLVTYGATRVGPVSLGDVVRCCAPYALVSTVVAAAIELVSLNWRYGSVLMLLCSAIISVVPFVTLFVVLPAERRMVNFLLDKIRGVWAAH